MMAFQEDFDLDAPVLREEEVAVGITVDAPGVSHPHSSKLALVVWSC